MLKTDECHNMIAYEKERDHHPCEEQVPSARVSPDAKSMCQGIKAPTGEIDASGSALLLRNPPPPLLP